MKGLASGRADPIRSYPRRPVFSTYRRSGFWPEYTSHQDGKTGAARSRALADGFDVLSLYFKGAGRSLPYSKDICAFLYAGN